MTSTGGNGDAYGGGGGGTGGIRSSAPAGVYNPGAGGDGIIVITYTPVPSNGGEGYRVIILGKLKINNGKRLKIMGQ
jgi:hypothetical protein